MVKCGTNNAEGCVVCTNCGASLVTGKYDNDPPHRDECFGLPWGGAIIGTVFGLLIILIGISWLLGFEFWTLFWPIVFIIIGIWIISRSIRRGR